MKSPATYFEFSSYHFDRSSGKAQFSYKIQLQDGTEYIFVETLSFPLPFPSAYSPSQEVIDSCLYNLHIALGMSYWKTYCPSAIRISTRPLSYNQAQFWDTVYTKGLGEFFYRNTINFKGLVRFPSESVSTNSYDVQLSDRSLVGIGGGKDSIVALELLKEQNKSITGFILKTGNESYVIDEVVKTANISAITVERTIDPKLFEINKSGTAYNGHVPISVLYGWIGVLTALLYDFKSFVVGNEKSANIGNVEYLGEQINHQWSKSEEFETLFTDYLKNYVTPSVEYRSAIREYSELEVIKKFIQYKQYFPVFSSCNRNFYITKKTPSRWCGECPKCAFVFAGLASFLPKSEVVSIFGKNLYADPNLIHLYKQLAGWEGMKPFECVGTFEETKEALKIASQNPDFAEDAIIKMVKEHIQSL